MSIEENITGLGKNNGYPERTEEAKRNEQDLMENEPFAKTAKELERIKSDREQALKDRLEKERQEDREATSDLYDTSFTKKGLKALRDVLKRPVKGKPMDKR